MSSLHNQQKTLNEEEDGLYAMQLASFSIIPMVLKAAIELDLLEIMAKAGPNAQLSPSQIASQLPTQNPEAPVILDRMLRLLASYSVLTCNLVTDKDGHNQRFYGLAPVCKYFIPNEDGISLAPFLLFIQDKVCTESSYYFKDAILEGGTPFNKAHGMRNFEYTAKDNRYHKLFNEAMYSLTSTTMKAILETYKGFEALNKVVDVGGGLGANLRFVVSKYPKIKGINFDLPHVIKDAPPLPGVEHVGGDMFTSVPKGDAIFMKSILHDWNDDQCLKILKCCYDALPESGKIIVVESIMPEFPETDLLTKTILKYDVRMYVSNPGGKERTKEEFESLARGAGFVDTKIICRAYRYWVIEFYKNM